MTPAFIITIAGLFLGVGARSLILWLRKLRDGKVQRFNQRYFYSALATFILGIIITLLIFPQFKGDLGEPARFEYYFRLFCLASAWAGTP